MLSPRLFLILLSVSFSSVSLVFSNLSDLAFLLISLKLKSLNIFIKSSFVVVEYISFNSSVSFLDHLLWLPLLFLFSLIFLFKPNLLAFVLILVSSNLGSAFKISSIGLFAYIFISIFSSSLVQYTLEIITTSSYLTLCFIITV